MAVCGDPSQPTKLKTGVCTEGQVLNVEENGTKKNLYNKNHLSQCLKTTKVWAMVLTTSPLTKAQQVCSFTIPVDTSSIFRGQPKRMFWKSQGGFME